MPLTRAAVFLDRDGTLNKKAPEGQYVTRLADFVLLPGVLPALATLHRQGFRLFVVTNQRAVARGLISSDDLGRIHNVLMQRAEAAGARIEHIRFCPHDLTDNCECRKPKPGMILSLAEEYQLELGSSWMIGDSISDVLAGRAAGCRTAYVGADECSDADVSAPSLGEVVDHLLCIAPVRRS